MVLTDLCTSVFLFPKGYTNDSNFPVTACVNIAYYIYISAISVNCKII